MNHKHLSTHPTINTTNDLNIEHLQAELVRIDLLIRREVQRWQAAGQDPGDNFRGLYVSDQDANSLLTRPLAFSWGQTIFQEPEEIRQFLQAQENADQQAKEIARAARRAGTVTRLEQLSEAFNLDRFDLDILLICLAPAIDLRYERIYGYLQDDVTRKRPSVNLVLDLLAEPGIGRLDDYQRFSPEAPLLKHHLVDLVSDSANAPLLSRTLAADETLTTWLLGDYQPSPPFNQHIQWIEAVDDRGESFLETQIWEQIQSSLVGSPVLVFFGPDQAAQHKAAERISFVEGRSLLSADLSGILAEEVPLRKAIQLVMRDARLTGAIPYLHGWDACLSENGGPPGAAMAEIYAFPGLVCLAGRLPWQAQGVERTRQILGVEFAIPPYSQRLALWKHYLGEEASLEELGIPPLAGQFQLTSGQIRDACATARDLAARRGNQLSTQDLFAAARAHSNPNLSSLARKILPRYTWEDIVLPADQLAILKEIVATVRGRPVVLDEWGVGDKLASSRGVTVLFAGPPGTGKTMAAEVIAADLGLDLYKIDLSTVVSKYIGETEKNLERIFNEAESSNAILFFDEADALFGKRSEVRDSHDRYANIEISYLLQRMEAYDGVTILATNLRANLDEAFKRRLQFAVDIPFPEERDRLRIWHTLFPPDVPRDEDIDFSYLASRFKLAGGNIRNVIVSAAYLAAADGKQVSMAHLLHGTRRELQKMGRLVDEEGLVKT